MKDTEIGAIRRLRSIGWLRALRRCPECGRYIQTDGFRYDTTWQGRCRTRNCLSRISMIHDHPVFIRGPNALSLKTQGLLLLMSMMDISPDKQVRLQSDASRATMKRLVSRFRDHIVHHVHEKQNNMDYGLLPEWADVEVDEVTLAKYPTGNDELTWANYIGLVARGFPQSLIIIRLPDRVTKSDAPGPGPIRLQDWKPVARKYLSCGGLILHSDSARAYDMEIKDIMHTKVVHQKKKVDGVWKDPFYTKHQSVVLPDGRKLRVVAGTQIIDGVWKILRNGIRGHAANDALLDQQIRLTQWRYWHQSMDISDAFAKTLG